MAHEIEIKKDGTASFFSVKVTPWHGLGHVVKDAPNMAEVLKLAGLDYSVSLRDLFLGDGTKVDYKAIARDTDNTVYGYVTGMKYQPLQNAEALEFFRPFQESGLVSFETAGSLRDGGRIWILARINDAANGEVTIAPNDNVRKYLLLSNGHDGKTGVKVGFCPIRVVCANTLAIAHNDKESKLMRIFHSQRTKDALEALRDTINVANETFEATTAQYKNLAHKGVKPGDIERLVTRVFYNGAQAESDREKIAREKLNSTITQLFEYGHGNTNPAVSGTAWALYQGVTQYLSYDMGRTQAGRLDSLWFGKSHDLNEVALKAAIEL